MAQLSAKLVRRLYAAPPDEFVAARADAIAAARAAGDRSGARLIAGLRKPTVAAWLVNLLAIHRPELMADLVQLSGQLRAAQRELRGDDLRQLSAHRRQVVSALVEQARALAVQAGAGPAAGKLPLAEVESTLTAALADEEVAREVRSGRLIRAVAYAGFGEVPRPRLRLVTDDDAAPTPVTDDDAALTPDTDDESAPTPAADAQRTGRAPDRAQRAARDRAPQRTTPDRAAQRTTPDRAAQDRAQRAAQDRAQDRAQRAAQERAEREAARQRAAAAARRRVLVAELAAATAEIRRAEADLARAAVAEEDAGQAVHDIEAELAELQRRRVAAQEEAGRRKLERKAAAREAVAARRRLGAAQAAVEELDDDPERPDGAAPNRVGRAESGR